MDHHQQLPVPRPSVLDDPQEHITNSFPSENHPSSPIPNLSQITSHGTTSSPPSLFQPQPLSPRPSTTSPLPSHHPLPPFPSSRLSRLSPVSPPTSPLPSHHPLPPLLSSRPLIYEKIPETNTHVLNTDIPSHPHPPPTPEKYPELDHPEADPSSLYIILASHPPGAPTSKPNPPLHKHKKTPSPRTGEIPTGQQRGGPKRPHPSCRKTCTPLKPPSPAFAW